jgi:nicotinate-nucleotide adenylyltransferase
MPEPRAQPDPREQTSAVSDPTPTRERRVGLFGGSFDPVHLGHTHAAHAALSAFALDRVVFVPARASPHKLGRPMAAAEHRTAMLALALAGEPRFELSRIELERPGPSYTIDTVRALPDALGEPRDVAIYLILGSDNVAALSTWRAARELLERVQPVIVHRAGEPDALLADARAALGAELARKLERGYLRLPALEASSTELRHELPEQSAAPKVLDPAVWDYIVAHRLYGVRG